MADDFAGASSKPRDSHVIVKASAITFTESCEYSWLRASEFTFARIQNEGSKAEVNAVKLTISHKADEQIETDHYLQVAGK